MRSDGKDFIMSLVVSVGYCIEVVGKGGQGVLLSASVERCFQWGLPRPKLQTVVHVHEQLG